MDELMTRVATENRSRDQRQNTHLASNGGRKATTTPITEEMNVSVPVLESLLGRDCASMAAHILFQLTLPTQSDLMQFGILLTARCGQADVDAPCCRQRRFIARRQGSRSRRRGPVEHRA